MPSVMPAPTQSQLVLPARIKRSALHRLATSRNPLEDHCATCLETLAFVGECEATWNGSGSRVEEVEEAVKEVIEVREDGVRVKDSVAALMADHNDGDDDDDDGVAVGDAATAVLERIEVGKGEYRDKSAVERYGAVPAYDAFKRRVFDVQFPESPYPGTASFLLPRRARRTTGDDDDGEPEMTYRAKRNLKCPITMMTLHHPMRSTVCVHVYSRDALAEMLARNRGTIHCPVAGCDKTLTADTVERDRVMERRVRVQEDEEAREGEELSSDVDGSAVLDVF
ncbi:E3 SUMO-protein ligase nse2 [Taphrina deformans PYCC 5710]|uniref:E3 SUMO-protein ligase nse2 n=1 Tax=Taphrina deformans (strain PYCC 5710 / ATCC 11124 / CBS 356.35 / IMI 108563 / JCM 9778 / NBRC 8474) TaxID=1097556 RepID=R4XGI6_TAPDE|nr:E3 SUMO-protein ligase nse2 [Taphrina deformans PYCC 5710]|eukprot:CCG83611.1 E3 SUMO-protein ligase nse2 [Taphrina deformans PYCC 5710]